MGAPRIPLAIVVVAAGLGGALAADDPVSQRRALMRDNARQERVANSSILGKFMPEKVTAAMQKIETNMALFVTLFPAGTETGGETHAAPVIWDDRAGFEAMAAQLVAMARDTEAAIPQGQDAFSIAWSQTAAVCAACHATYAPMMVGQ